MLITTLEIKEGDMKLSCSSLMLSEKSLTRKAMKLKELGFSGMSVFVEYSDWNDELHEEVLGLEKATGIKPCEFVFSDECYGHLMDSDPCIRGKARKMYSEALGVCMEIGAATELEFSYAPRSPLPVYDPYQKMTEEQETAFLTMYREMGKQAEGSSAYLLLEDINRYESPYLNTLADCAEVVSKTGLSNAGILCDVFHMTIEEGDIPAAIRQAGSLIKHVHLGDTNRLTPRRGFLDWKSVFAAFHDIGYEGYCSLECAVTGDADDDLRQCAAFLLPMM